jgi:serine/threonine-protein kinase
VLGAAERAAVDSLTASLGGAPATTPTPASVPASQAVAALERRAAAGPYELLGTRRDAGFPEIREHGRKVRGEIAALQERLPPAEQASRIPALLAHLDAALALLGAPGERLMYDARHGNFQGVAHCVTAGTPAAVVEARRRALLAEQPENARKAAREVARARVAGKLGNVEAALAAYEKALALDPLDLSVHQAYWELKRRGA